MSQPVRLSHNHQQHHLGQSRPITAAACHRILLLLRLPHLTLANSLIAGNQARVAPEIELTPRLLCRRRDVESANNLFGANGNARCQWLFTRADRHRAQCSASADPRSLEK